MNQPQSSVSPDNVTVYFSEQKIHSTEFDGQVDKIEVNGVACSSCGRSNDTQCITKATMALHRLVWVFGCCAFFGLIAAITLGIVILRQH